MPKIAVVFPGSDSHFIGMYKALYDEYSIVRDTIHEAEQATGIPLGELCFKGPLSVLSRPENAHAAIVAFGVAAFRVFVSETGITPQFCAGHSLGEYTALVCAGAMKLSDTLKLVQLRTEISKEIQTAVDGGMTIVDGIDAEAVEKICKQQQRNGRHVYVSCYNSSTQVAISGLQEDVEETEKIIGKEHGSVTPLFDSAPFHCPVMERGAEKLQKAIARLPLGEFRYPVMSNYTGKPYVRIQDVEENLVRHLSNPVRWEEIIRYFESKGVRLVIDFSARNIFEGMIQHKPSLRTICFGVREEREKLFQLLNSSDDDGSRSTFISKSLLAALSTPNQHVERYVNGADVADHYHKLSEISMELEQGRIALSNEVKRSILLLLKRIFDAKKLGRDEQTQWFQQILDETSSTYLNLIEIE
ncbi:[acyl-carrier-protein] S-malonyltransferase [Paenibacillus tianmuensis]|uniref:[acyl-carrier-protein] S-malonyltransferase n=1 Tax=Paenibacillus tianmuensis TaxID=624147 RepID=A0A1G4QZC7_9BACL|nr:ACP S-malonyltransferase [Paenibacillus tianmuensis]SCW50000.1 [acyl-carrier-protein] S-malonyltransferase [Paenibacillus tianmuensis]